MRVSVPDITLQNTTVCSVLVDMHATVVKTNVGNQMADAEIHVPVDLNLLPSLNIASTAVAPPSGLIGAGPVVDIQTDVTELPNDSTVMVTLPYALNNNTSDDNVRAYRLEANGWVREPATQWIINTLDKTISYTTNHFSIRQAMAGDRPTVASVPAAAVIDNGNGAIGDKRILLVDAKHLSPLGVLRKLSIPDAPIEYLQSLLPNGETLNAGDVELGSYYIKDIKAISPTVMVMHTRAVWVVLPTSNHVGLTLDQDELTALSVNNDVLWRVAVAGNDAITDSWTPCTAPWPSFGDCISVVPNYRHVQQSIRDFTLSPNGKTLYFIGDTSIGDRKSRSDGIYMVDISQLSANVLHLARISSEYLVVGESASIAVSDYWGGERVFVIGSGPNNWRSDQGYMNFAASQARTLQAALINNSANKMTFTASGPYGNYEFTSLQDLLAAFANSQCYGSGQYDDPIVIDKGFVYNLPRNLWLTHGPSVFDDLTKISRMLFTYASTCQMDLLNWSDPTTVDPLSYAPAGERALALAMLNLGAREEVIGDLLSNMVEAGQVAVYAKSGNGLIRAGSIPLVNEPSFDVNGQHSSFKATISDPAASLGVDREGVLWVRTTEISADTVPCEQRPYACPQGSDPALIAFSDKLSAKPVLINIRCEGAYSGSIENCVAAYGSYTKGEQDLAPNTNSPTVGRNSLAFDSKVVTMPAITVTNDGQVVGYDWTFGSSNNTLALLPQTIGRLPGPLNAENKYLNAGIVQSYANSQNGAGRIVLVSASYDDDNPSNNYVDCGDGLYCHAPESLLAGFVAQDNNNYNIGYLSGRQVGFNFTAYDQIPKSAAALLGSKAILLERFVLPRPLLSRLNSDGAVMGNDLTLHDVTKAEIGQIKISPRYLVANAAQTSFTTTNIDLLQVFIDVRFISTGRCPRV